MPAGPLLERRLALVAEIEQTAELLEEIVAQTRTRLSGEVPDGSKRIVSLHDPDARPIAKGRLGKPVEFGYKAQITDNCDGIVLDLAMFKGNPPTRRCSCRRSAASRRSSAVRRRAVTADRGYGEASVETGLVALGVKRIAIPRKGRPGTRRAASVESARRFRTLVKWRTGSEGRISHLKHSFGFERTVLDGIVGATTWCGWGLLAHNSRQDQRPRRREEGQADIGPRKSDIPRTSADTGPPTGRSPTNRRTA